jgi:hypothetical protein
MITSYFASLTLASFPSSVIFPNTTHFFLKGIFNYLLFCCKILSTVIHYDSQSTVSALFLITFLLAYSLFSKNTVRLFTLTICILSWKNSLTSYIVILFYYFKTWQKKLWNTYVFIMFYIFGNMYIHISLYFT